MLINLLTKFQSINDSMFGIFDGFVDKLPIADFVKDAICDSVHLVPFLFIIFLFIELFETYFSNKIKNISNPKELDYIIKDDKKIFAFIVNSDEMMPLLDVNDIAIIEINNKLENSRTYLIWFEDKTIIRKIIDNGNNNVVLQAMNPYYPIINTTKDKIEIIGKVIKAENSSAFK